MEASDNVGVAGVGIDGDQLASQGSAHVFSMGEIVEVMRRMWPGMNKPGGIARITLIHYDSGK
ncbi:hypothetical protein EON65_20510 [archaeon]|nr:MAG: hypothetical protein EON65_20510 [archaeon]